MNLQTEEIEFENQLVDISPMETHLKKNLNSILKLSVIGSESELSVDKPSIQCWSQKQGATKDKNLNKAWR